MIILQAQNMAKRFNGEEIFDNVNLTIQDKSRIALVGRNGAGKSTLIKMLIGDLTIDEGTVTTKKNLTIGYLSQNTGLNSDKTIYEEMLTVFADLKAIEAKIHNLEIKMGQVSYEDNPQQFEELTSTYDNLRNDFEQRNGYGYEAEIRGVLHGFGFLSDYYDHKISDLSGGQKTQLALAKLLLEKPELLILDEPTNHLDVDTITWLESYIQGYKGALLIISHDRYFLDRIVNEVYDLSNHTLHHYTGNYSQFTELKQAAITQQLKQFEKQQSEIKKLEEFVDKNIARASTTKMAQSRRKQLAKMELLEKPQEFEKSARFAFQAHSKSGNNVLKVSNATIGYSQDHVLSQTINLDIKRHQIIAIVGPNGVGKSTLLKSILNIIPLLSGSVEFGTGVDTGYYDQEQKSLNSKKNVIDEIWDDHKTTPEKDIRSILGSFLFSGDDVLKSVRELSGGEKARLLLTKLAMQHNNFLILDEPTNHLDVDSREVLEKALLDFDGTILFVSHDRYFINKIATNVVEINQAGSTAYLGNYDYYLEKKAEQLAIKEHQEQGEEQTAVPDDSKPKAPSDYELNKQHQKQLRKLERDVAELEEQLDSLTTEQSKIEAAMVSEAVANDLGKLTDFQKRLDEIANELVVVEDKWETASLKLESFS